MPMHRTACALTVALSAFFSSSCLANDVDPTQATGDVESATALPPPAPVTSKSFFRSWFRAPEAQPSEHDVAGDAAIPMTFESTAQSAPAGAAARAGDLVVNALGLLGVNYRRGGNTPESGFDCSGMVRYVFQNALGLDLPRRAVEISQFGAKIDRDDLKPGDLVFYNTLRKTFSHVGIYLGNNRFIHAPSRGSTVRIDDMSQGYWAARFNGARRVK